MYPQCGWASSNQSKAWVKQKGGGRMNLALYAWLLSWDIHFLPCCFSFLSSSLLCLRPLHSDWITPQAFLGIELAIGGSWDFSISNFVSQFLTINLFIHTHECVKTQHSKNQDHGIHMNAYIHMYIWRDLLWGIYTKKVEEPEIKLPTFIGSLKKQESSRKSYTSASLTMPKPLTVWITTNCGNFLKRREYETTLSASWEIYIQVKKQQLELDMEQQTGSKLGKEYIKPVYCHPANLTYMQSTSWKMLGWMKHKLESRLPGEISITLDMQKTAPLRQKVERN